MSSPPTDTADPQRDLEVSLIRLSPEHGAQEQCPTGHVRLDA